MDVVLRTQERILERRRGEMLQDIVASTVGTSTRADCLYRLGRLASNEKREDLAVRCFVAAVQSNRSHVASFAALGSALSRQGHFQEALGAHLRALTLEPLNADHYASIGQTLAAMGLLLAAVAVYTEALRIEPSHTGARRGLADGLLAEGHALRAIEHYERERLLYPDDVELLRSLGEAQLQAGQWRPAVASFRQCLDLQKLRADLWVKLGHALVRLGMLEDAADAFRRAISIQPHSVAVCQFYLSLLELMAHKEDIPGAWLTLGAALAAENRLEDAARCYREVLARRPSCLLALTKLVDVNATLGNSREVIRYGTGVVAIDPYNLRVHRSLQRAHHLLGDVERGWKAFADSWTTRLHSRGFEQLVWDGTPLDRRTILLWADEALGDTVQFSRYIPFVKASSPARVIVQCHSSLVRLIEGVSGIDRVVAEGASLPVFDVHAPFSLLPVLIPRFRTAIPYDVPYIAIANDLTDTWRRRLGSSRGRRIGIVWAGNPFNFMAGTKFTSLSSFAPLANLHDTRFISLQLGEPERELLTPPTGFGVERHLNDDSCVTDTAALILNLDLVITVDTMVAHLTGALGRPVWTLLPFAPAWMYLSEGESTPWYPTMRLFRQTRRGDWLGVFAQVRAALEASATPPDMCRDLNDLESNGVQNRGSETSFQPARVS